MFSSILLGAISNSLHTLPRNRDAFWHNILDYLQTQEILTMSPTGEHYFFTFSLPTSTFAQQQMQKRLTHEKVVHVIDSIRRKLGNKGFQMFDQLKREDLDWLEKEVTKEVGVVGGVLV